MTPLRRPLRNSPLPAAFKWRRTAGRCLIRGQEWQPSGAQGLEGTDSERAGGKMGRVSNGRPVPLIGESKQIAGIVEQTPPGLRQLQPAPRPVEQGCPKIGFQHLDLLGYAGLGEMDLFGGPRDIEGRGHGHEGLEMAKFRDIFLLLRPAMKSRCRVSNNGRHERYRQRAPHLSDAERGSGSGE